MKQYNVTGMSCAACSARVEKAVGKVPGVTACSVSLLTNSMGVEGTRRKRARPSRLPVPMSSSWRTTRRPGSGGGLSGPWAFCWC